MYRTVASDLSDVKIEEYDMLCFFSLTKESNLFSIISQILNRGDRKIAVFRVTTQNAAEEAGLKIDVMALLKKTLL